MSAISTHVLDTARGRPAEGIAVTLWLRGEDGWVELARGATNADGRIPDLLKPGAVTEEGTYRLRFAVGPYFDHQGIPTFYPYVDVVFAIAPGQHYHVPLLLSPFGYATYRGS